MKTGLPRHITVIDWPGSIDDTSTSMEASASAAASGFIWSMKRPERAGGADGGEGAGGDQQEVATGDVGADFMRVDMLGVRAGR